MIENLTSPGYGVGAGNVAPGWDTSGQPGVSYLDSAPSANAISIPTPAGSALSGIPQSTGIGDAVSNFFSNNPISNMLGTSPDALAAQANATAIKTLSGLGGGSSNGIKAFASDLFLRSVIIILGFIFTAVGLTMFKNGK
jgi:hypothetical protein